MIKVLNGLHKLPSEKCDPSDEDGISIVFCRLIAGELALAAEHYRREDAYEIVLYIFKGNHTILTAAYGRKHPRHPAVRHLVEKAKYSHRQPTLAVLEAVLSDMTGRQKAALVCDVFNKGVQFGCFQHQKELSQALNDKMLKWLRK